MEMSEIENWTEIEHKIADVVSSLIKINVDTEKDVYGYFQGIKELSKNLEIVCPYCDKVIDPLEVGINPQKTMENWRDEDRTEPNSMSFQELREHLNHVVTRQIVDILIQTQTRPTGIEQKLNQLEDVVSTLTYISELLADLPKSIEHANTNKDIMESMRSTLTDIQKRISITATN